MGKVVDITGQKFGLLTVISRAKNNSSGRAMWNCSCDCGNICDKPKTYYDLKSGKVKSCGCIRVETTKQLGFTHKQYNDTEKRLKRIWSSMIQRCYYSKHIGFNNYGGRNIIVCDEWLHSEYGFKNFYDWSVSNNYENNLTLDRKDFNGNYEPNNCRWVTMKIQQNNRSNNRLITINNETKTLSEWAYQNSISPETLKWRINNNWNVNELFIKPKLNNRWRKKLYE